SALDALLEEGPTEARDEEQAQDLEASGQEAQAPAAALEVPALPDLNVPDAASTASPPSADAEAPEPAGFPAVPDLRLPDLKLPDFGAPASPGESAGGAAESDEAEAPDAGSPADGEHEAPSPAPGVEAAREEPDLIEDPDLAVQDDAPGGDDGEARPAEAAEDG